MNHNVNIDISRRLFLRGRWRSKSEINASCLNNIGVYCQACKDDCNQGAIVFNQAKMGIQLPVIISERCTHCRKCVETCPSNAITISDENNL